MKNRVKPGFVPAFILSVLPISACIFLGMVLPGCSQAAAGADMAAAQSGRSEAGFYGTGFSKATSGEYDVYEAEAVPAADNVLSQSAEKSRKLVQRASLRIQVEDPEKTEDSLMAVMDTYNAYAASTSIYEDSRSYTIRVPSASYKSFFSALSGMGKLLHRTESAEDVTIQFYDLEGRLATKQELLKTFQGYLGRAQNIEEILSVEKRIAELQQEIDWTGTELRSLADLADYATIDLTLTGPAGSYNKPGLGDKILSLFRSFGGYASAVLVTLIGIVVFGVPSILLLALLFWLFFGKIGLLKKLWRAAAGKTNPGNI
ncbi:MAG: DUF4349 domain-containing protein [Treponema sp.]|jgi:hypothetical protein|nr:DUF4349 domain-containing protein [Treponema sp.]